MLLSFEYKGVSFKLFPIPNLIFEGFLRWDRHKILHTVQEKENSSRLIPNSSIQVLTFGGLLSYNIRIECNIRGMHTKFLTTQDLNSIQFPSLCKHPQSTSRPRQNLNVGPCICACCQIFIPHSNLESSCTTFIFAPPGNGKTALRIMRGKHNL